MQNTNINVNTIIKTMYDSRILLRNIYMYSSSTDIYNLKDNIEKSIRKSLKDDCIDTNINILSFEIIITLKENCNISNKKKYNTIEAICDLLRSYVENHTTNSDMLLYISNLDNPIVDIFTVGDSIKLIL